MSSMMPCAKDGAEPTRRIVLLLIRREMLGIWTLKEGAGQATRWILIPKYVPALRNAACADSGRILTG